MSPLLTCLLAVPGTFLVMPLLSVATGIVRAHLMPGVSRTYGLLTGCACAVAVVALMFFRAGTLLWLEAGFAINLSWWLYPLLTVAIGVASILAIAGICQLRQAEVLPPELTVTQS